MNAQFMKENFYEHWNQDMKLHIRNFCLKKIFCCLKIILNVLINGYKDDAWYWLLNNLPTGMFLCFNFLGIFYAASSIFKSLKTRFHVFFSWKILRWFFFYNKTILIISVDLIITRKYAILVLYYIKNNAFLMEVKTNMQWCSFHVFISLNKILLYRNATDFFILQYSYWCECSIAIFMSCLKVSFVLYL